MDCKRFAVCKLAFQDIFLSIRTVDADCFLHLEQVKLCDLTNVGIRIWRWQSRHGKSGENPLEVSVEQQTIKTPKK